MTKARAMNLYIVPENPVFISQDKDYGGKPSIFLCLEELFRIVSYPDNKENNPYWAVNNNYTFHIKRLEDIDNSDNPPLSRENIFCREGETEKESLNSPIICLNHHH